MQSNPNSKGALSAVVADIFISNLLFIGFISPKCILKFSYLSVDKFLST
mgnify:CR=1 FL=1